MRLPLSGKWIEFLSQKWISLGEKNFIVDGKKPLSVLETGIGSLFS